MHAGAEPRNIVVKHNRSIGKQKFQIMLKFGISPSASSEVLCRYMALRMQGEKSEIVFRNQIVRLLSHLGTELLEEFSDPDNKKGQRAFEDFVHSKLGGYAQAHGLVTFTARFDRLTQ
ncbi:MAG TPA: hypothetical protein DEF59_01240 [Candidatus Magasanikbacteria bacterium]|nr:hypothetical protein [Candidatus Magasanikbacteria bacterium]